MKLTRRNFLAWAGLSSVGAISCNVFPEGEFTIQSPAQLPEDLVKGQDNWYATLCRQCPSSEGIVVRVMEGRAKKIQGNPHYPTNQGKHSARCEATLQALYHPERVTGPMRKLGGRLSTRFDPITWEQALATLRTNLEAQGQGLALITEPLRGYEGLIADRFASAMGGQHIGFEALDNNTYRTAVKNVYGQELLPDFDLEHTNYLLSFGADFLSTWISPTRWNVGYGEFRQGEGREHRGTFIQVDPRFSMTAANADKWFPLKPGTEGLLALSLAHVIISEGLQAPGVDVGALTGGQGAEALEAFRPEAVGPQLGLPPGMEGAHDPAEVIKKLARDFAGNRPSLAIGGDSAAAHSNGLFNLEAIYALNYLVGSVGTEGGVKFNPGSPIPGLPATARVGSLKDWVKLSEDLATGRVNTVMVHQADPVYGLPNDVGFRQALSREDLFIVSFSSFIDDTTVMADLILPDRISLEGWGTDIPEPGPGFQAIGFQQPVVNPLPDLDPRGFGDILLTMAQDLGRDADLPWNSVQEALRDGVSQLFLLNRGTSTEASSEEELWTRVLRQGGWWDRREQGPGQAAAPQGLFGSIIAKQAAAQFSGPDDFYLIPFSHNTLLDGRNAHLPWAEGAPDPMTTMTWQTWVEMNDRKAAELGLREGDVVRVESSSGAITAPLYVTPALPPNVIGVPLGQGHRHGPEYATARGPLESANVLEILALREVEGTGSLAWASNRASVTPTGQSIRVAKFEGWVTPREIAATEGEEIIKTVSPNGE